MCTFKNHILSILKKIEIKNNSTSIVNLSFNSVNCKKSYSVERMQVIIVCSLYSFSIFKVFCKILLFVHNM